MTPTSRLILVLAAPLALWAAAIAWPPLALVAVAANAAAIAAALADLVLSARPERIEIRREVSEVLSVGAPNRVRLHALNRNPGPVRLELADEPPPTGLAGSAFTVLDLPTGRWQSVSYEFVPSRRGPQRFTGVHLRFRSRLGLWLRWDRRELASDVRVYPDIRAVRRYDVLARANRLYDFGLRRSRLRGQGREFERLRDYHREDEIRSVDWKATARHQKLISREFTAERNQNVVVLLDCGRSMRGEAAGLSLLDHAVNAVLILSYVALRAGDRVSVLAFSNRLEKAVGPLRGRDGIRALARATYALAPRLESSDYDLAYQELARRQTKRALVVLVTHSLDENHLLSIARQMRVQGRLHLHLAAVIRDVALARLASIAPAGTRDAYHAGAAAEMMEAQARTLTELRRGGVLVVDTPPDDLTPGLINRYLEVKARQLL